MFSSGKTHNGAQHDMPAVLRKSGPDIQDASGAVRTPRAIIAWCDTCGAENAAFSEIRDGKRVYWCGWDRAAMQPVCRVVKQEGLFE